MLQRLDNLVVAQPSRALQLSEKDKISRSLGWDLDPRPLPLGSKLFEPYLTKVTRELSPSSLNPDNNNNSLLVQRSLFSLHLRYLMKNWKPLLGNRSC